MSLHPLPVVANIRTADLDARLTGSPIVAGDCYLYVVALTGANAGKWFKTSDNTWDAAEQISGTLAHKGDGHWQVSVDAECWIDAVEYLEYAKESGNLHVPISRHLRCGALHSDPISAAANTLIADLVAKVDGSPIIVGTVNLYVVANTGANAGKWFRTSDNSWQAAEAIAGVMAHKADGHWTVSVDAECWTAGVDYTIYAKETTDLHTPVSYDARAHAATAWPAVGTVLSTAGTYGPNGIDYTGTYDACLVSEVVTTATFGPNSSLTGTVLVPSINDVQWGVAFGAGSALTGVFGWPVVANVLIGVGYGANNVEYTGTVTLPATGDVQSGVTFGAGLGLTGTFVPAAIGDVESGVAYGDAGEFVGTFIVPATGDVQNLVGYGNAGEFIGTFTEPGIANVLDTVSYGALGVEFTGTYNACLVSEVVTTATFGPLSAFTGTVLVPSVNDVQSGVVFGAGSALTGVFGWPIITTVLLGIGYGANDAEFIGTVSLPSVNDVQAGVTFGAGGTLTGTFGWPIVGNVIESIGYGANNLEFIGTYHEATVAEVQLGVTFGPLSAYVGTYVGGGPTDYPSINDVQTAVAYNFGALVGVFDWPLPVQVLVGTGYGANGVEFVGTLVPGGGGPGPIIDGSHVITNPLTAAIRDRLLASTVLATTLQGVYDTMALMGRPPMGEDQYPYAVVTLIDAADASNFRSMAQMVHFSVDLYDSETSAERLGELGEEVTKQLNGGTVTDSTGTYAQFRPLLERMMKSKEPPDDAWVVSLEFVTYVVLT